MNTLIAIIGIGIWVTLVVGIVITFRGRRNKDEDEDEVDRYMEKMKKDMKKVSYSEGWSEEEMEDAVKKGWATWEGSKFVFHGEPRKKIDDNNLKELVRMMQEKHHEEEREKKAKELSEYYWEQEKKKRKAPTGGIRISGTQENRKANVGKANIAIPFGLNETEKQVLEAFYGDKPLGG